MKSLTPLIARHARHPLLLEQRYAEGLLERIIRGDELGPVRESRLNALFRKVGIGRGRVTEMEDAEYDNRPERKPPAAYSPLWAQLAMGEPEAEGRFWSLYEGIALLRVNGPIGENAEEVCGEFYHGYDSILTALADAQADGRVKATLVSMNTPGGVVTPGITKLSNWIRENRAQAGSKPIWFSADMMCSAGYHFGSQGDHVTASDVSLIGSIGAIYVHIDASEAYAKAGYKIVPITFGKEKAAGAHWAALSETALADIQSEIDQVGRDFVAAVCAGRPHLTPEAVIGTEARVFLGRNDDASRSALDLGLIDEIADEQQTFEALLASVTPADVPAPVLAAASSNPKQETTMFGTKKQAAPKPSKAEAAAETPETEAGEETEAEEEEEDAETEGEETAAAPEAGDSGAQAISASAEAKAHPQMALNAISEGLTLKQFKGMVAGLSASGPAGKPSPLREAMAGVKRVGADAATPPKETFGGALVANAKARAEALSKGN